MKHSEIKYAVERLEQVSRQKINKIRMNLKINLSHLKLRMKEILKIF